jgi:hypothetical protein
VLSSSGDGIFTGIVELPTGRESVNVIVTEQGGEQTTETVALRNLAGSVYEIVDGVRVPVGNAVVTVYEVKRGNRALWDGSPNPVFSDDGFSWYVPDGTYFVVAQRDGYEEASVTVRVINSILAPEIEMRKTGAAIVPILPPVVMDTARLVSSFLNSPQVETTAKIASPVVAALAVASVATLATGFPFLTYLRYLFTSPFLLFGRSKRKTFGVVYNGITKVPLELAIIRLYRSDTKRLVKSVVTNAKGQYFLFVGEPGDYYLTVTKPGFVFPSTYLQGVQHDGTYLDVYSAQQIRVTEKNAVIAANIPLDPSDAPEFQGVRRLKTKRFLRVFQKVTAPLGVLGSLIVLAVLPSVFALVMVFIQIIVLLFSIKLAWPKKPKGWGYVREGKRAKGLGNVVVRLFEPRYNKLVESTLTDSRGRYAFLLGPNEYYVAFDKEGFTQKIVRPIDFKAQTEPAPLTVNVALDRR